MIVRKVLRLTLVVFLIGFLAGCKLLVIVFEGGSVESTTVGDCRFVNSPRMCVHDITEDNFSETFRAVPDFGWEFERWYAGSEFLCSNQANPTCIASNVGASAFPALAAIVASDQVFFLMPIFKYIGPPYTVETAVADGKEWARPWQFVGASYASIAAACPGGVCSGLLNDYDVTGFTWASGVEVASLLHVFSGMCPAYGCEQVVTDQDWLSAAVALGFGPTGIDAGFNSYILGFTSELESASRAGLARHFFTGFSCVFSGFSAAPPPCGDYFLIPAAPESTGAWLYRVPGP